MDNKTIATVATAALAGAFSGLALPAVSGWLGTGAEFSLAWMLVFVGVVALPAHAFVLGFRRADARGSGGGVDMALLTRVGAWLLGAAAGSLLPLMLG